MISSRATKDEIGKVGCLFPMLMASIRPHAEFGPNDHQEDALHFIRLAGVGISKSVRQQTFLLIHKAHKIRFFVAWELKLHILG